MTTKTVASVQWKILIRGEEVRGALDVSYGLEVARDRYGQPVDAHPRLRTIRIVRRADGDWTFGEWIFQPFQEYWKDGEIQLLDPRKEDGPVKVLRWKNGFLKRYEEHVPHVNVERSSPQIEILDIAVEQLRVNDVELPAAGQAWSH